MFSSVCLCLSKQTLTVLLIKFLKSVFKQTVCLHFELLYSFKMWCTVWISNTILVRYASKWLWNRVYVQKNSKHSKFGQCLHERVLTLLWAEPMYLFRIFFCVFFYLLYWLLYLYKYSIKYICINIALNFACTLFWLNPSDWLIFCHMITFMFTSSVASPMI